MTDNKEKTERLRQVRAGHREDVTRKVKEAKRILNVLQDVAEIPEKEGSHLSVIRQLLEQKQKILQRNDTTRNKFFKDFNISCVEMNTTFIRLFTSREPNLLNPGGENSTLIRGVCATGVLNLSPCSGVGKPKKDTLLWSYHFFLKSIVLYCIVLYCIVLYCIVLYCIVLYCIALHCIALYCIVLYCILLYWRQRSCLCFTYLIK